jgi:hypothetical protein
VTIDNTEATTEVEHAELLGAGLTARQIAMQAVRIADSDIRTAFYQLAEGTTEEALKVIDEAIEQMTHAKSILTGRIWSLAM